MTSAPVIYAKCEVCYDECNCHPPDEVRLHGDTWLCYECYSEWEDTTQTHWSSLPRASEWITVRETPAETQEELVYVQDRLRIYVDYINNTGQVPLPVSAFDEDWDPIGPTIRQDMVRGGLVRIENGGITLHEQLRRKK